PRRREAHGRRAAPPRLRRRAARRARSAREEGLTPLMLLGVPHLHELGRALVADAVVVEDVLGGRLEILAREDVGLAAVLRALEGQELLAIVAQHLDELAQVLD